MTNKKEVLNSKSDILIVKSTYIRCWYCQLNGQDVLDKHGCCKRCGTSLKKWPKRGKLAYPVLNSERIAQNVLGIREKFEVPLDGKEESKPITRITERRAGKVNHCHICWQKTIIFIWSTSRVIDKEKLKKIEQFKNVINLERLASPICWACIKEYNLIVSSKEEENESEKI